MLGRASHEGRPDDAPESIRRRLELYHEQTAPVVERYRTTGKLVPLHADRPIDSVYARDPGGPAIPRPGGQRMIIRKGEAEIERIARAGALVAETIAHVGEHVAPGVTTAELDDIADAFIQRARRGADLQGLQGLSAGDLHLRQRRRRARHPRHAARGGGRSRHDRRRRHARRLDRRQRVHLRRRRRRRAHPAAARHLPGRALGGDRAGAAGQPHRRHLARRPGGCRGWRLLGRAQPRRPRRRPPLPRGPARAELRLSPAAARGSPRG